jgi:hypothetical protein
MKSLFKLSNLILLAILSLSACKQQVVNVVCTNPSDSDRIAEVIEVDASTIQAHLEGIDPAAWVVSDQDGTPVVSQLIEDAEGAVQKLIFQVDLTGQERPFPSVKVYLPLANQRYLVVTFPSGKMTSHGKTIALPLECMARNWNVLKCAVAV